MEMTCTDILMIKRAMGKHHDIILIENEVLKLHWWTTSGKKLLVVTDFSGHNDYFQTFIKKVLTITEEFNKLHGNGYADSDEYINFRKAYLGE